MVFVLCFTWHNYLQGRPPGVEYYLTAWTTFCMVTWFVPRFGCSGQ